MHAPPQLSELPPSRSMNPCMFSADKFPRPFRRVLSALLLCVLPSFITAQPAATGSISGRVQNEATGQYLNNARVTIKGTDLSTFTDETGMFRIGGVPAG